MTAAELARALEVMTPRLFERDGVVLWNDTAPSRIDLACFGSRTAWQRHWNQRFIVADLLDALGIAPDAAAGLVAMAEMWLAMLRGALALDYPARRFEAEIVGAEGAEHEPLELCVRFWEVSDASQ